MASSVLAKLRGKTLPSGMAPEEVARQIALATSLAERQARTDRDQAVAAAIIEVVEALGLDVAKEVKPND